MLYRRLTCMLRFRIHIISLVSQTKLIFFFCGNLLLVVPWWWVGESRRYVIQNYDT